MARVTATDYECDNDLLPPVCAKCGAPADERVPRPIYFLHSQAGFSKILAAVFGLFLFPPLFLLIATRYSQTMQIRVPMCADHRNDWAWRDRAMNAALLPLWSIVVIIVEALGVVLVAQGYAAPVHFCVGPVALAVALLVENVLILPGAVKLAKPEKGGVRLSGVHDEFVAALLEDRARDRVANPDRRALLGDMRDDFDDEPV